MNRPKYHEPVMADKVLEGLNIARLNEACVIDATLGNGGHTIEILKKKARVLGIELDEEALAVAKERISACPALKGDFQSRIKYFQGNFTEIGRAFKESGLRRVDAILFDLGVNSLQLTSESRGFSFGNPKAELDMRLDRKGQKVKAKDLLNLLSEKNLSLLFAATLSQREAKRLAGKVVIRRKHEPFSKVGDFLSLFGERRGRRHPATKALLALRMAVNSELANLKKGISRAFRLLESRGRLVVISFHSGEDRLVKTFFKKLEREGKASLVTKKPLTPSDQEAAENPRSRSAKLRVLEKEGL